MYIPTIGKFIATLRAAGWPELARSEWWALYRIEYPQQRVEQEQQS